jgi:hypothetical protein
MDDCLKKERRSYSSLDDLQCDETSKDRNSHNEHARNLETGGGIWLVAASARAIRAVAAGGSVWGGLDVVALGLAEDVTLDNLGVVELVEVVAREVTRGLGIERSLDISKSWESSPV